MKNLITILLSLALLSGCMAAIIGGAGVGAYYAGKYYGSRQEAYRAYVLDCHQHNLQPLSYKDWRKIQ